MTAVFHRDSRAVWVLTCIACPMVIVGSFFPDVPPSSLVAAEPVVVARRAAGDRGVRLACARDQDQLARETERAEAAERIKTEVLTNLSQEIRGPLRHDRCPGTRRGGRPSRSGRRLGMVRGSARRLASTVDNLVDLTKFEDKPMPVELVEVGLLLRQTAEARRRTPLSRQISLTIDIPDTGIMVAANAWALRRILENKISQQASCIPGLAARSRSRRAACATRSRW